MAERSPGKIIRLVVFGAIELAGAIMTGRSLVHSATHSTAASAQPSVSTPAPASSTTLTAISSPATTAAPPATTSSVSQTPTTTSGNVDLFAGRCESIPQGTVTAVLTLGRLGSGHGPDPRTSATVNWVGIGWATKMTASFRTLAPFAIGIVIDDPQQAVPTTGPPIDRLGQRQVWAVWDGTSLHKAVRTWDGNAWTTLVDAAAEPMTIEMAATGVFFFGPGVTAGERIAAVVATADACASVGTSGGRATIALKDLA